MSWALQSRPPYTKILNGWFLEFLGVDMYGFSGSGF